MVSWGTNPAQVAPITGAIPSLDSFKDENDRKMAEAALKYMDIKPGTPIRDVKIQRVDLIVETAPKFGIALFFAFPAVYHSFL